MLPIQDDKYDGNTDSKGVCVVLQRDAKSDNHASSRAWHETIHVLVVADDDECLHDVNVGTKIATEKKRMCNVGIVTLTMIGSFSNS